MKFKELHYQLGTPENTFRYLLIPLPQSNKVHKTEATT